MKKFIIAAAILVCGITGVSTAKDLWNIPEAANAQALATSDYGGVDIATSNFSNLVTTVVAGGSSAGPNSGDSRFDGNCRLYGVTFSTGLSSDFVQFYDTGSWLPGSQGGASTETIRLFNMANSTGNSVNNGGLAIYSGYVPVGPRPVRFKYGLLFRSSTNAYNSIIVHYYKEK